MDMLHGNKTIIKHNIVLFNFLDPRDCPEFGFRRSIIITLRGMIPKNVPFKSLEIMEYSRTNFYPVFCHFIDCYILDDLKCLNFPNHEVLILTQN